MDKRRKFASRKFPRMLILYDIRLTKTATLFPDGFFLK